MSEAPVIPVPGRNCGDCAMCCKLPVIPELNKPYNAWCQHCGNHQHCDIYDTRPQRCRDFFCHFMLSTLGEEWRPNKCRLMLSVADNRMRVMVDPARPDAWRKEPYFSAIRHWSTQGEVHVMVGKITHVVFPDHIDNVGEITDDHQILILETSTAQGVHRRAERILKSEAEATLARYNQ